MKCVKFGVGVLRAATVDAARKVAGYAFEGRVRGKASCACGELYFDGPEVESFELMSAAKLLGAGERSGQVLAFARKTLGLRAVDLSDLLDAELETLSRWEHDKVFAKRSTIALYAVLVRDKLDNSTETLDAVFDGPPTCSRDRRAGCLLSSSSPSTFALGCYV